MKLKRHLVSIGLGVAAVCALGAAGPLSAAASTAGGWAWNQCGPVAGVTACATVTGTAVVVDGQLQVAVTCTATAETPVAATGVGCYLVGSGTVWMQAPNVYLPGNTATTEFTASVPPGSYSVCYGYAVTTLSGQTQGVAPQPCLPENVTI